nr:MULTISPECIES: hypothetical protein [unclassified Streptomyces]
MGAGVGDLAHQRMAVVAAIGRQQHPRGEAAQQSARLFSLAAGAGAEDGIGQGTGAAFHQRRQVNPRMAGGAVAAAVPFEDGHVVGCFHGGGVPGHQAQFLPERTGCCRGGHRASQPGEQQRERFRSHPTAGCP